MAGLRTAGWNGMIGNAQLHCGCCSIQRDARHENGADGSAHVWWDGAAAAVCSRRTVLPSTGNEPCHDGRHAGDGTYHVPHAGKESHAMYPMLVRRVIPCTP